MKPCLRRLHSPDVMDLRTFVPPDPAFAILVQLLVGPCDEDGEESFDVVVCSPQWLQQQDHPVMGRHHLVVRTYQYADLVAFVESYLEGCAGTDWQDVARMVGRLGHWEFEDYRS